MKKLLILPVILISLPSFAACPIEEGATSCSVAQFHQDKMVPTYAPTTGISEFSGSPDARLRPSENPVEKNRLQDFGAQPRDFNYNADCQFGVCQNSSGAPQPFGNRGRAD